MTEVAKFSFLKGIFFPFILIYFSKDAVLGLENKDATHGDGTAMSTSNFTVSQVEIDLKHRFLAATESRNLNVNSPTVLQKITSLSTVQPEPSSHLTTYKPERAFGLQTSVSKSSSGKFLVKRDLTEEDKKGARAVAAPELKDNHTSVAGEEVNISRTDTTTRADFNNETFQGNKSRSANRTTEWEFTTAEVQTVRLPIRTLAPPVLATKKSESRADSLSISNANMWQLWICLWIVRVSLF